DGEMMIVEAYYSGGNEDAQQNSGSKLDGEGEVQYSTAVRKLLECHAGNRLLYDSSDDDNGDKNHSGCSAVPPKESSITKNNLCVADSLSAPEQYANKIKRTQFASKD
ncbi:hypothetical protein GGI13_007595, partial [Coemansia sp. RSA 455]